jgi:thiol-disulfide isomerase/thioredoxin
MEIVRRISARDAVSQLDLPVNGPNVCSMKRTLLPVFGVVLLACAVSAQVPGITLPPPPEVEKILRPMADFYRSADRVSGTMKATLYVEMDAMKQEMPSRYTFAFERPNRVALVAQEGMMASTIVSDGKQLTTYLPMFKRYSVGEAPDSMLEIATRPESMMGGATYLSAFLSLFASDPYSALLNGVTKSASAGSEKVDGIECERLTFEQLGMRWEIWVTKGKQPELRRLTMKMDMSQIQEELGGKELPAGLPDQIKNMRMRTQVDFTDWKFGEPLAANTFQFTPPAGATKGDSVFGAGSGGEDEEEAHALIGKPAPSFSLDLLGGGKMELAQHAGKEVVILDFWATWCGPCVRALPILAEVAEAYRGKGVMFYAVNQQEFPDQVKSFLDGKKLTFAVPMDRSAGVAAKYGVDGIPQTVVIDKQGVVRAVHVGFSPDLKKRLTSELDAILEGKDPADAKPKTKTDAPPQTKGVKEAWKVEGRFRGVAAGGGRLFAIAAGLGIELDAAGKEVTKFPFAPGPTVLRLANLVGDKDPELIGFTGWGPEVRATNLAGTELWKHAGGQGIDDAWPVDLDGDGLDEVVVGYNGATGLHVLSNQGKPLWKFTEIGNVWHVCAGDVTGDGEPEVITTSAEGKVHLFSARGKKLKDIESQLYANMVRFVPAVGGDGGVIIAGGSKDSEEAVVGLSADGKQLWETKVGVERSSIDEAAVASGRPWVAIAIRGQRVLVLNVADGSILAEVATTAPNASVAWVTPNNAAPVLVIADGAALRGWRLEAK